MDRAKTYGILGLVSLVVSYFMAYFAVHDGTPLTVWFTMASIASGITGCIFSCLAAAVAFKWDA